MAISPKLEMRQGQQLVLTPQLKQAIKLLQLSNMELSAFVEAELERNPLAAVVFHWHHAKRQARLEGIIEKLTEAESDAYFKSRPLLSRIGASISRQSTPIESRRQLVEAALSLAKSVAMGREIRRPEDWGGYRMRLR